MTGEEDDLNLYEAHEPDEPQRCANPTCDQTEDDGVLVRCECNKEFCSDCIEEVSLLANVGPPVPMKLKLCADCRKAA